MHFSIPDTSECTEKNGATFTAFNIHINGVYHCSVRYKLFHSFNEQLKKEFGTASLPFFPPKRLLSLTPTQLEDRRFQLERYIQIISQNPQIAGSTTFNGFLLTAQQESQQEEPEDVSLDVFLMNGHTISLKIVSTDQTDDVLESVASQIELQDEFVYYFGLFLVRKEDQKENSIVRRLQEFESPYISLKAANRGGTHCIVLRKSFWDPTYEDDLLDNRIAMNLLFVQAVSDIERGWVVANKEQHKQLAALQQKGSKKEYLRLARTLRYYGYLQFKPGLTDYPHPDCRVLISAGNKELSFRVQLSEEDIREAGFKVTRMRCWRITSTIPEDELENEINGHSPNTARLELSFEYLVAKETLKWITVISEQAILMSMCLQGMVDELILKKDGRRMKRPQDRAKSNQRKETGTGSSRTPTSPSEDQKSVPNGNASNPTTFTSSAASSSSSSSGARPRNLPVKRITDKLPGFNMRGGRGTGLTENDAFELGIGDDDL